VVSQRLASVRAKQLADVQDEIARLKAQESEARMVEAEQHVAELNAKAEGFRRDIATAKEHAAAFELEALKITEGTRVPSAPSKSACGQ
jgi:hydroxypyruvate isomerase